MKRTIIGMVSICFLGLLSCTKYEEQVNFRLRSPERILTKETYELHYFSNNNDLVEYESLELNFDDEGEVKIKATFSEDWQNQNTDRSFIVPNNKKETITGTWSFLNGDKTMLTVYLNDQNHLFNIRMLTSTELKMKRVEMTDMEDEDYRFFIKD